MDIFLIICLAIVLLILGCKSWARYFRFTKELRELIAVDDRKTLNLIDLEKRKKACRLGNDL